MQQILSFMNRIQPLLAMYAEIIACFVAASVLSLVIGWLMHRGRARRQLADTNESWDKRYRALEEISRVDTENLEEQLQNLATETRGLQADRKLLSDSLRKAESNIQNFRAETIELNRQHAETQERLQRIIQQKDRELLELGNRLIRLRNAGSASSADLADAGELTSADTIAINGTDLLDATVRLPDEDLPSTSPHLPRSWHASADDSLDASTDESLRHTADAFLDTEDATIAMDEEARAMARQSLRRGRSD